MSAILPWRRPARKKVPCRDGPAAECRRLGLCSVASSAGGEPRPMRERRSPSPLGGHFRHPCLHSDFSCERLPTFFCRVWSDACWRAKLLGSHASPPLSTSTFRRFSYSEITRPRLRDHFVASCLRLTSAAGTARNGAGAGGQATLCAQCGARR